MNTAISLHTNQCRSIKPFGLSVFVDSKPNQLSLLQKFSVASDVLFTLVRKANCTSLIQILALMSGLQWGGRMRKLISSFVKSAARGQWFFILQSLGVSPLLLDGRNHPCPACGGKDRFQFTATGAGADYGRFACRGLDSQGGDGFKLVMHLYSCGFTEAVQRVAAVLGMHQESYFETRQLDTRVNNPADSIDQVKAQSKAAKLQALFNSSECISQSNTAGMYLLQRGIDIEACRSTQALRHCPELDYWHDAGHCNQPKLIGRYPALLAAIHKPDGALAGLHRIYLAEDARKLGLLNQETGERLGAKKLTTVHGGALAGAACRLFPLEEGQTLALAEGIETALAVHQLTGLPVWACISAGGLKAVILPEQVHQVLVFADNDEEDSLGRNVGKLAALAAGKRFVNEGRACRIFLPPMTGTDWLDVLNQRQQKEVA